MLSLGELAVVADFIEFGELMCRDALMREEESCGGHFREEHQTNEGSFKGMILIMLLLVFGSIKEMEQLLSLQKKI